MNKDLQSVIVRATEGLQINTGARLDANRASKRPSAELHKVNEAVRLLMAAMRDDKVFESQISEDAKKKLWNAWLGINSALMEQERWEKEMRRQAKTHSLSTLRNPYICVECGRSIVMANGSEHSFSCSLGTGVAEDE